MRNPLPAFLAALAALLFPVFATGQTPPAAGKPAEPAPTDAPKTTATPAPPAAKGGAPVLPQRYRSLLTEAMDRFQIRDFPGTLKFVDRADEVLPPTTWSLNVRGAVAIETRDFATGEKYCVDALKIDPSFFPAKFNLCEIPFLQGKYAEARARWLKLYAETKKQDPTGELLAYRIMLTFVLEKDLEQAKEWLAKIPFPSQTPAYHYGNAVMERQQGHMDKWDEWLKSAVYVWPDSKRSSFTDVLIQLGWMKRE